MEQINKKLVIVGDGACGKTSLLFVYCKGEFPLDHIPTVFEIFNININIDEKTNVFMGLWDTAGQEEFDRLRPLSYPNANVVVILYSIILPSSLENVLEKWFLEVKHFCPRVPIILVGSKKDLREDPKTLEELRKYGQEPIKKEEAKAVAEKIKAYAHIECSAKTKENVDEVFMISAKSTMHLQGQHSKNGLKKCVIL